MVVIARRAFLLAAMTSCAVAVYADDSADVHTVIGDMANALSAGEVSQAMSGFSRKCANFDRLSESFDALTGAYFVENTVDFTDEEVSAAEATVSLRWDLALTTKQGGFTTNRSAELKLKLVREGKHWRITEFGPTAIFDPSSH